MTSTGTTSLVPPRPRAPIGVYDSGVGGLSVLKALRSRLPDEFFIYVADSGHAPYGDRDEDFVGTRAVAVTDFFVRQGVKALVLACNTVSVVAAGRLRSMFAPPIVAMEPAIKPAIALTKSKVILVMATSATIKSPAVARLCRRFAQDATILLQPCPGLVQCVESGAFDREPTVALLESYIRPALVKGADTIVLGCTHYAFLTASISRIAGPHVSVVEPSEAIARQLIRVLGAELPQHGATAVPREIFFTSGRVDELAAFLATVWGSHPDVRPMT